MIKNVVFDIGDIILIFDDEDVLNKFTDIEEDRKFILDNVINSPEWNKYGLIDTGYLSVEDAIKIVQDRTNHVKDDVIEKFWTSCFDYTIMDKRVLDIIKIIKDKGYKIYLLSNINPYMHKFVNTSNLLELVDGYVFSYIEHMIKPYDSIYNTLINRYSLNPKETLYIDDRQVNIDTGNKLGLVSCKVEPDNYDSLVDVLKNNNII